MSLKELINIDVNLFWATLPVIMSPGQKTWRHARPRDLLLCCGWIHNMRKCSLNAIIRRILHFRKHNLTLGTWKNLLSVTFQPINGSSDPRCPKMPKYPFEVRVCFLVPVLQLWFSVPKLHVRKSSRPFSAAPVTFIRASSTLVTAPFGLCLGRSSSELSRLMESASPEKKAQERVTDKPR